MRGPLAGAGFESIGFTSIEEPVWFGADAEAAYEFVGEIGIVKGLSDGLDPDTKAAAHEQLRAAIQAHETPEGVRFDSGVSADLRDQGVRIGNSRRHAGAW